jgi:hypothetical protein
MAGVREKVEKVIAVIAKTADKILHDTGPGSIPFSKSFQKQFSCFFLTGEPGRRAT